VRATAPSTALSDTVLADAAAERDRSQFGTCIGALTTGLLWLPALVVSVVAVAFGEIRLRRRPRSAP
jgi:hypothetical protein